MERTTKLAHLILVSKYYPVANYSYPRSEGPPSSSSSSFFFFSRTPYNSRRSSSSNESRASPLSPPPGLVDDRSTDSEASSSADDDDFRYHVHGGELWDSFLESGHRLHADYQTETVEMAASASASASFEALCAVPPVVPAKDYPALIASPQRIKRRPVPTPSQQTAWPLSDQGHPSQPRKPSPTYSVFPKMVAIPSGTCTRQSSSSQLSTTSVSATDAPYPPAQKALPPPPPPPPPPQGLPPLPPPQRPAASQYRSASPRPRAFSPASSLAALHRPATSHGSRPASPMGFPYSQPPTPPPTAPLPALPPLSSRSPHPSTVIAPRPHHLSHAEAAAAPCHPAPKTFLRPYYTSSTKLPPRPPPEPLPRSVFEYDTDSDDEDTTNNNNDSSSSSRSSTESPTLSFFRLYRRSQSPNTNGEGILSRRRGSASKTPLHQAQSQQQQQQQEQYFVDAAATAAKDRRRRRKRTNTIDSLPPLVAKQADLVLSRMLGRRSR